MILDRKLNNIWKNVLTIIFNILTLFLQNPYNMFRSNIICNNILSTNTCHLVQQTSQIEKHIYSTKKVKDHFEKMNLINNNN